MDLYPGSPGMKTGNSAMKHKNDVRDIDWLSSSCKTL